MRRALRQAADGLPDVSTYTIRAVLLNSGWSYQHDGTWCETGLVKRVRKGAWWMWSTRILRQKNAIERPYHIADSLGIALWCEDEAGSYQTKPYPGSSWDPEGQPGQLPHEYHRKGIVKFLTLFHPATGLLRTQGVPTCTKEVLQA